MGRSNGYRPKVAVRDEVLALRARLSECRDDQWVRATIIMDRITGLLGHSYGPMRGKIEPRSCRYCKYFGHTKQWCKVRIANEKAREEREIEAILREDQELKAKYGDAPAAEPYEPTQSVQALAFDGLRIPYSLSPHGIGPVVGVPGEEHHGKWTFGGDGGVCERG